MATISINTSGLAGNMKPQVQQALNTIINDPTIRGQIGNNQANTLTFQFRHSGTDAARAVAVNEGPNQTITFNLDKMGVVNGQVYFDAGSLLPKPFIDTAIHETMHVVYPGLTGSGSFHGEAQSPNAITRGQDAAGEFAFRTFTTSTIQRLTQRPGLEEQDMLNAARDELNTNPTTRPDLSGVIWDSYNTYELMRAAIADKTSIYFGHLPLGARGKKYDQAPESSDPWVTQEVSEDGSSMTTKTDFYNTQSWSSQLLIEDINGFLKFHQTVLDAGNKIIQEFDTRNARLWEERVFGMDPTGNVTAVQVKLNGEITTRSAVNPVDFSVIGQIFGSAIGRAIVGKDGNPFVSLTAGTVAGFVGQKFVQALINACSPPILPISTLPVSSERPRQPRRRGPWRGSSFLTAEIATSIGLEGRGGRCSRPPRADISAAWPTGRQEGF